MGDKLPLAANVRWFQLATGALVALIGHQLWLHYSGTLPLSTGGVVLRYFALVGLTLVFLIYLQNVYRFGLVPDYSRKCRFCNGPVNRYSEFCEHCGADLIAPEKLLPCPKCGVEVYEGTKFCPECGATVTKQRDKGRKGHKKRREQEAAAQAAAQQNSEVGWSTPLDAASPPPWEDERR